MPVTSGRDTATTTTAAPTGSRSFGDVEGLVLTASPTTGLRDGDLLFVRVGGLDQLASPLLVLCAGDVTPETAMDDCDLQSLERADTGPAAFTMARQASTVRDWPLAEPETQIASWQAQ